MTTALGREPGYRLRVTGFKAFGHTFADFRVNVHDLPEESGINGARHLCQGPQALSGEDPLGGAFVAI